MRLGADSLDGIREALALVLDSARWFTIACAAEYTGHFEAAYRKRAAELGTDVVPFADWWLLESDALYRERPAFIEPAVRELRRRWAMLLDLPPDTSRVKLHTAGNFLRERAAAAFPAGLPEPWPLAVHHSPVLMIAAARPGSGSPLTWVLGELHPGRVTSRYATLLAYHPAPAAVHAAIRHDLRGPAVWVAETETGKFSGTSIRQAVAPPRPGDVHLVYAQDSVRL